MKKTPFSSQFSKVVDLSVEYIACVEQLLPVSTCYLCFPTFTFIFNFLPVHFHCHLRLKLFHSFPKLTICQAATLATMCRLASDHLPGTRSHYRHFPKQHRPSQLGLVCFFSKHLANWRLLVQGPAVNAIVRFE